MKGQQSVMLTCSVADGTWDWLSPSHPSGPTYKTGTELFCVPLHAPDRATEELGCLAPCTEPRSFLEEKNNESFLCCKLMAVLQ